MNNKQVEMVAINIEKDNLVNNAAQQLIDHPTDCKIPVEELIEVPIKRSQTEKETYFVNKFIVYLNNNIRQVYDPV